MYDDIGQGFVSATALLLVMLLLAISTSWVHVAANAKAFRRITPQAAKRRSLGFSVILGTTTSVLIATFFFTSQQVLASATGLAAAFIMAICYLVASRKLGAVLQARGTTRGRLARAKSERKGAVVGDHLATIMGAAKEVGSALCGHMLGAALFALAPGNSIGQYVGEFLLFNMLGCIIVACVR